MVNDRILRHSTTTILRVNLQGTVVAGFAASRCPITASDNDKFKTSQQRKIAVANPPQSWSFIERLMRSPSKHGDEHMLYRFRLCH